LQIAEDIFELVISKMEKECGIKYFKVADITVQVQSDYPIGKNTFHSKFERFEVFKKNKDSITIFHHVRPVAEKRIKPERAKEVYKKNQWQIFKDDCTWFYHYNSIFPGDPVDNVVGIMNRDYSEIHIYPENMSKQAYAQGRFPALTLFNTDQMIFAKLLSDRKGLVIHSNGFNINGNGVLIAGVSGSGKSTLSGMLKKLGHEILCDDRMFVRSIDGRFHIFGNWCYGSHPDVSPSQAPLSGVIFLKKGGRNRIKEITDQKAIVSKLMPVIVKPMLDVEGWGKYLSTFGWLKKSACFYEIEFDLSGKAGDIISDYFK
jgi:hypothetical protein